MTTNIGPWPRDSYPPVRAHATANITPFTYYDGLTFLEILSELRSWLSKTLIPGLDGIIDIVDGMIQDALENVEIDLEAMRQEVNDALASIDVTDAELRAYVDDVLQQVIDNGIDLQDAVMAGIIENRESATVEKLNEFYGTGYEIRVQDGQSNGLGTQAEYAASIDDDFEGVYYYGVTPGESDYRQIRPVTSLPLNGGMITKRPYGVFADVIVARQRFVDTGIPQLLVPTVLGGAGFRSHNVTPGRWLVSETQYPNLSSMAVDYLNEAIDAAGAVLNGPLKKITVTFNGGEADRDIGVTEEVYLQDTVDYVNYKRSNTNFDGDIAFVFVRQHEERRIVDGVNGLGVDDAICRVPSVVDLSAVVEPPKGFATDDRTHMVTGGHRRLAASIIDGEVRARGNRVSRASLPVENVRVSPYGVIEWDAPRAGHVDDIAIGSRRNNGVSTVITTVAPGVTEFTPTDNRFVDTDIALTARSDAGYAKPVNVRVDGLLTSGLMFSFWPDSMETINAGTVLRAGDWSSAAGAMRDFGFAGVSGVTTVEQSSAPSHKRVRFLNSALASGPDYFSVTDFTVAMVYSARLAESGTNHVELFGGSTTGNPYLFLNSGATAAGFRATQDDEAITLPVNQNIYNVLIARKAGGTITLDHFDLSRTQNTVTGVGSNTALDRFIISSGRSGARSRLNGTIDGVMCWNRAIGDSGVISVANTMLERIDR